LIRHGFFAIVALLLCASTRAGVTTDDERDFDPRQSAALLVGIKDFRKNGIAPVPYAADDAVDLAFEFALGQQPPLVPAKRVVLALSGVPEKKESRLKLADLRRAGAVVVAGEKGEILRALRNQARAVGREGMLIVGFATHGFNADGVHHLLAYGSDLKDQRTMIGEPMISETLLDNDVSRALVLIDACRERLERRARPGVPDPRSIGTFLHLMRAVDGKVVISAAASGGYAYDDEVRQNGVFTAALLDGLHCAARKDSHRFITVASLHDYVERHVLSWIRKNRDPEATKATQLLCEGQTRRMPLVICVSDKASAAAPQPASDCRKSRRARKGPCTPPREMSARDKSDERLPRRRRRIRRRSAVPPPSRRPGRSRC